MTLPYCVYILKCSNNQFYTGFSTNIDKRLKTHQNGEIHFTKGKSPIQLVYVSYFRDKQKAYDFERYIKTGSGIAFGNKRLV